MNDKRRELLESALLMLDRAHGIISRALSEEQDCLDNMPENLQASERCEAMESAVDSLEAAESSIEESITSIENAIV